MVWFTELGEDEIELQQSEFDDGNEELGDDELSLREAAFMSGYDADGMDAYYRGL
ncbi:hypothetical protein HYV82_02600 [Candidatus Woesearchaeota archaeon]|nr:hypothetical protein [Candidatus Woesearchaeota archaeon]